MPLDPERALTGAILAQLRADAAVSAVLSGRVYDQPPVEPEYPLLLIGRSQSRPFGGVAGEGVEHTLTLTVSSRYDGAEEARRAAGLVRAALDDAALSLTDHRLISLRITFVDTFRAADWRTTFSVVRLRAVTEPL